MKRTDDIERSIREMKLTTSKAVDARILTDASEALAREKKPPPVSRQTGVWRKIMKSKWTRLSAAAATIIAAVLAITVFDKSATTAYAIEQTIEANRGMRSVHVQQWSAKARKPDDIWLEFDDEGLLARMRNDIRSQESGEVLKTIMYTDNIIRDFTPSKKKFIITYHTVGVKCKVLAMRERFDPTWAAEQINQWGREGKVEITIDQPKDANQPITLTATGIKPLKELEVQDRGAQYGSRYVLQIDSRTKLVQQRESYWVTDGEYKLTRRCRYLEYDQPIDPAMFILKPPPDVEVEDRTKGVGIPQGNMTDPEVAAEIVRQYFEALIAEDYEKASKLHNGTPAHRIRKSVERRKISRYLRIVSIGKPVPLSAEIVFQPYHSAFQRKYLRKIVAEARRFDVPITIECEKNGVKKIVTEQTPVEPVPGKSGYWMITRG